MGILDQLAGLSPEQNQGLLAAAAQILQNSGPSRQPYSLGQALGTGISTYQGTMEQNRLRKLEEQRQAQQDQFQNEYRTVQMDGLKSQKAEREAKMQFEKARQEAVRKAIKPDGTLDNQALIANLAPFDPEGAAEIAQRMAPKPVTYGTNLEAWRVNGKPRAVVMGSDGNPKILENMEPYHKPEAPRVAAGPKPIDPDALLPESTLAVMAEQYLAGDTSVMQNLGRGAQGSQNIIRLRNEIARRAQESGIGGAGLAAKTAEYMGTRAGQRSAGTRIANVEMAVNEALNLIPLALESSNNVARSGFLPFGKAEMFTNKQTNDPAMREFVAANNALVNVYSRAISPTGQPTVSDKEHARELLQTAYDHKSYVATVKQMQREMEAARQAPQQVRDAFSASVTGKGGHGAPAAPAAPAKPLNAPLKGQIRNGYKYIGGDPKQASSWEPVK